jgi:hypothetical protein
MRDGQKCLGVAALRPREFVAVLDQMLEEIRISCITVGECLQELDFSARTVRLAS